MATRDQSSDEDYSTLMEMLDGCLAGTGAGWRGKRAVDVILASLFLCVFSLLMLVTALAVRVTSPGPVLFRQTRMGRNGRVFRMCKFRTMCVDAEDRLELDAELKAKYLFSDHKIPCHEDPRVTRLGRLLRRSSIDELPQLLNVLAGHMSVVGPRPVRVDEVLVYGERRFAYDALRPGMTGLWQVKGRDSIKFPERAELDVQYWQGCAPALDCRILAKTPAAVLSAFVRRN